MSGIIDCEMHIGDEVFVHGYIDEIRNDTIIIRNVGGYFGTSRDEVFYYEEDERGYGTMNEADRKTEPKTQTKTQNSNLTFEKDECAKEYEELGLKELKELIEADRKTEPQGYCNECKWYGDKQVCGRCRSRNLYAPKDEPQTERSACDTCHWYNSGIPCGVEPSVCKREVKDEGQTERSE